MAALTLTIAAAGKPVLALSPKVAADRWDIALEKAFGSVVVGAFEAADGVVVDPVMGRWLSVVGESVATQTDGALLPRFVLIDSNVSNAWSAPGGTIVVTRGLLESVDSDDALATVLAHECGHVARRHAWKQISENIGVLALLGQLRRIGPSARTIGMAANVIRTLGRSRSMESEADQVGVRIARSAGWDPRAFLPFVGNGSPVGPVWLSTHPSGRTRQGDIERQLIARSAPSDKPIRPVGVPKWRPLPPLAPAPDPEGRRSQLTRRCAQIQSGLAAAGLEAEFGGVLQQALLLTTDVSNPLNLVLSSRAWTMQQRVNDLAAGLQRIAGVAPAVWDRLEAADPVDAAVGRGELQLAIGQSESLLNRLVAARRATGLVLANLNVRGLPSRRFSVAAPEAAVQEGLLRYAEGLVAEAKRVVNRNWELLSQARIRAYSARIGTLAGTDQSRIAWLEHGLIRRSGLNATKIDSGVGLVRAALAVSAGVEIGSVPGMPGFPDHALAAGRAGVAPTVAMLLRMMVLDAEREWE